MLPVSLDQKKKDKKDKQSILPKKPRFEPRAVIAPGDHPVTFTRASDLQ